MLPEGTILIVGEDENLRRGDQPAPSAAGQGVGLEEVEGCAGAHDVRLVAEGWLEWRNGWERRERRRRARRSGRRRGRVRLDPRAAGVVQARSGLVRPEVIAAELADAGARLFP